jgi:plasmid stabilization system protein ParE
MILSAGLEVASTLAEHAERGRVVPEIDEQPIRELFLHKYRLIYRVTDDSVEVLAFLHGSRDFARWTRERSKPPHN